MISKEFAKSLKWAKDVAGTALYFLEMSKIPNRLDFEGSAVTEEEKLMAKEVEAVVWCARAIIGIAQCKIETYLSMQKDKDK